MTTPDSRNIVIGQHQIRPGERRFIDLPLPPLYTHTSVSMPVHVINGKQPGPVLFVTATIHGDEINGIEVIRRLLDIKSLNRLKGALIAVPVVNVYGFVAQSRYLPDRRDLNRSFPGSERGSMAARLADVFMQEIISQSTHGIDLHTAAAGRDNLPQVRIDFNGSDQAREMARAFSPPVILDSAPGEGTLRAAVGDLPIILYEAGEALRFNEIAIRVGVKGILRVMRQLKMLPDLRRNEKQSAPIFSEDSNWTRAPQSGILRARVKLGDIVTAGETLGIVADPFGEFEEAVESDVAGIVIGMSNMPLVHEGEALFHIAKAGSAASAAQVVDAFQAEYDV
ncbi:MAG: succinylglutamate desuccinylase/aspartoacylase family protein [Gammaproteobacteria bacterium]|nr:succinylglutamate desuccinylase/aspartoacylase family protein [Gammaproteobacteria bacterium]